MVGKKEGRKATYVSWQSHRIEHVVGTLIDLVVNEPLVVHRAWREERSIWVGAMTGHFGLGLLSGTSLRVFGSLILDSIHGAVSGLVSRWMHGVVWSLVVSRIRREVEGVDEVLTLVEVRSAGCCNKALVTIAIRKAVMVDTVVLVTTIRRTAVVVASWGRPLVGDADGTSWLWIRRMMNQIIK